MSRTAHFLFLFAKCKTWPLYSKSTDGKRNMKILGRLIKLVRCRGEEGQDAGES